MTDVEQIEQHLERLLDMQRSVEAAIVVTTDGLLHAGLSRVPEFDKATMQRFSAAVAAMCGAAKGAATVASGGGELVEQGITAAQVIFSNRAGWLLVVPAGSTAWLALYAPDCHDVGLLGSTAESFADQVGVAVSPPVRPDTRAGTAPRNGS
ncbi:MAG TPA: roadblock/LC7 domain-containing protein [Pseudonocardiaceae bacterium]|nr:roadblock/LC7 domain-containing protein [Pseudonocardiaceae bacterium]